MDLSLPGLLRHAVATVQSPREGARALMAMRLHPLVGLLALALMAVTSPLLSFGLMGPSDMYGVTPLGMAGMQGFILIFTAFTAWRVGRVFGGQGRFDDAVLLIAWLQFILICLQVVQLVLFLVSPMLAQVLGIIGLGLFLWLLTAFVAEMHGFPSMGAVFGGVILVTLAIAMVLTSLLMFATTAQG